MLWKKEYQKYFEDTEDFKPETIDWKTVVTDAADKASFDTTLECFLR